MNPTNDVNVVAKLRYYPNTSLSTRTQLVPNPDNVKHLVTLMFDTMTVHQGIGLAANQIGVGYRIFVMRTEDLRRAFINPTLKPVTDAGTIEFEERCLSFPGVAVKMNRYKEVDVEYENLQGEINTLRLNGIESICAQHEIDHLDGKTFVDHLGKIKRSLIENKIKKKLKEYKCQQDGIHALPASKI